MSQIQVTDLTYGYEGNITSSAVFDYFPYRISEKGFILISHDRDILDACIDHVLVLNRKTIEVQSGKKPKVGG